MRMAVQTEKAAANASPAAKLSKEERSKDEFFKRIALLSEAMINAHGREFAMGALVLAARFIAENKAFTKPAEQAACGCGSAHGHDHHHHHPHHKT
jgi:hypothetical protein